MGKEYGQPFIGEKIWIANKLMKKCSAPKVTIYTIYIIYTHKQYTICIMQIKTAMRYNFTPIKLANI